MAAAPRDAAAACRRHAAGDRRRDPARRPRRGAAMIGRKGAPRPPLSTLQRAGRLAVLALLAVAAAALWRWRGIADPRAMTAVIARFPATPLVFVAAQTVASLLFVPRTLLGSLAGATAGFLIARYINSGLIDLEGDARIGPLLTRVEQGGWRVVAIVRLIPVLPHSLTNYALGLTRLPLSAYTVGSVLGQMPITIACVNLGTAGGRLIGGASDPPRHAPPPHPGAPSAPGALHPLVEARGAVAEIRSHWVKYSYLQLFC